MCFEYRYLLPLRSFEYLLPLLYSQYILPLNCSEYVLTWLYTQYLLPEVFKLHFLLRLELVHDSRQVLLLLLHNKANQGFLEVLG